MDEPPSVVARWLDAGDSGDVAAFDDLLHRDVVVQRNVEMARVIVTGALRHDFAGIPGTG